jgi:hypothetical protein
MSGGFDFDWRFVWNLHLGKDIGLFFSVASSGLSSGLEHGGRQMLRSNSQGLLDREHGKMRRWVSKRRGAKVSTVDEW